MDLRSPRRGSGRKHPELGTAACSPTRRQNLDATGLFLARAGVTDAPTFNDRIAERRIGGMAPLVVGEDLSWNQVAAVRSHQSDYPELTVVSRFRRHYPYRKLTSHVVGHLQPVSREQVEADPRSRARHHDWSNRYRSAERLLHFRPRTGNDGSWFQRWAVNSAWFARSPHGPGTTSDSLSTSRLQKAAAAALGERSGAVVALDPRSGAVRVLYSAPSFDPDRLRRRLSRSDWQALQEDPVTSSSESMPAGSVPSGFDHQTVSRSWRPQRGPDRRPTTTVYCNGSIVLYGHRFRLLAPRWSRICRISSALSQSRAMSTSICSANASASTAWRGGCTVLALVSKPGSISRSSPPGSSAPRNGAARSGELRGTPARRCRCRSVRGPSWPRSFSLPGRSRFSPAAAESVTPHIWWLTPSGDNRIRKIDPDHLTLVNAALTEVVHGALRHGPPVRELCRWRERPEPPRLSVSRKEWMRTILRRSSVTMRGLSGWAPLDEPALVVVGHRRTWW